MKEQERRRIWSNLVKKFLPVNCDGDHVHEGCGHVAVKEERENSGKKLIEFDNT